MDVQELVRLARDGASDREIATLVGLNRRTVSRYRRWATDQHLLEGPLPNVAEFQTRLQASFPPQLPPQQTSSVAAYQEQILAYRRQGVELAAIRARLEEEHSRPISYDAVWRLVRRVEAHQEPEAFVRVEVPPGAEAQVDFGYAGRHIDPATGRLRKAWVFVLLLSFSRHVYAEVVFDQRVETWLLCHRHAFESWQGVPGRIVLDNLKAAILRASVDDPTVQRAYRECATHYGFRIDPNPPRTPRLKGKVEQGGVHYVKRNFLAGRPPTLVNELNRKLRMWTTDVAGQRQHGTTKHHPFEQFQHLEQPALRRLPPVAYDLAIWKQASLYRDCYVVFDGSYYSAPYRLVGQTLWIRGAARTIELFTADHQHIATHDRATEPGERKTILAHLPPYKVAGLVSSRETCRLQAASIGPATSEVIQRLLDHRPEDRLHVAQRVLRLVERASAERLESACVRALHYDTPDYPTLKRILATGLEVVPVRLAEPPPATPPRNLTFVRHASEFAAGLLAAAGGRR